MDLRAGEVRARGSGVDRHPRAEDRARSRSASARASGVAVPDLRGADAPRCVGGVPRVDDASRASCWMRLRAPRRRSALEGPPALVEHEHVVGEHVLQPGRDAAPREVDLLAVARGEERGRSCRRGRAPRGGRGRSGRSRSAGAGAGAASAARRTARAARLERRVLRERRARACCGRAPRRSSRGSSAPSRWRSSGRSPTASRSPSTQPSATTQSLLSSMTSARPAGGRRGCSCRRSPGWPRRWTRRPGGARCPPASSSATQRRLASSGDASSATSTGTSAGRVLQDAGQALREELVLAEDGDHDDRAVLRRRQLLACGQDRERHRGQA